MRTLYLLIFITLLNHSVFAGTRVAASLYAIHLDATPFTVGALMALYALLPVFFAVSMGRWTDRVGARAPMLIGSVAIGAGAILPFGWPGMGSLYVASVLIGSGFMLYQVAAQHIVGYIGKPEDRAVNFSVSALGFSVSGFIGPMLAGFGIDVIGYTAVLSGQLIEQRRVHIVANSKCEKTNARQASPGNVLDNSPDVCFPYCRQAVSQKDNDPRPVA